MINDDEFKLHLVIGEDIPENCPEEFHKLALYIRDENDNLILYDDISLPYLINYSEFQNVSEDDPRYIFKEGYEPDTKCCKYTCVVKPFGERKGVYRVLNLDFIKIMSIDPMIEIDSEEFKRLRKNK